MSDRLEFRHLKYLIAVAEEENISRAAKRLYLAQPSLSHQLKRLEEALLLDILVRESKGVRLTEAGNVLILGARKILRLRDEVVAAARAVHNVAVPPLRIGFSPFVDFSHLDTVCSVQTALFPGCEINPKSGSNVEITSLLEQGTLDIALLTLPVTNNGLEVYPFAFERLVVCMRSDDPLSKEKEILPAVLKKKLTIFWEPKQHPEAHARLMEMLGQVDVHPEIARTTVTPRDLQWMVQSKFGYALIREGSALENGLVTRPIAGVNWTVDSALIFRKSPSNKTVPVLVRELRKRLHMQASVTSAKKPGSVRILNRGEDLPLFG